MAKKQVLTTHQQIEKLNKFHKLASDASASKDIVMKLGGLSIYAGFADFLAFQTARLLEQIIIKGDQAQGKKSSYTLHDDSYFYEKHIRTRIVIINLSSFHSNC